MRPAPGPGRSSPVLLVLVGVALAVGAAATLVAGAASAPAFHSPVDTEVAIPLWALEAVFVIACSFLIGLVVWMRVGGSQAPVPGRVVVGLLVVFTVAVLLVAVLDVVPGGGGFDSPGGNLTGSGPSNNNNTANPGSNLTGPGGVIQFLHLPPWALFVGIALLLLVVGAVAIPRAWAFVADREPDGPGRKPTPAELAAVGAALATAAGALDEGQDPRAVVIALYASLLARVGPMVGGVDADTPEEIRVLHLVRLGIRDAAAQTLTRLFEEARYSTHPMGPDAAQTAWSAIADARDDLARLTPRT